MAYKKDIRAWLKEVGLTWEELDKIWEECCEINWKCKTIAQSGRNWYDLTMELIKTLPSLKETTLRQLKEKEKQEELENMEKMKAEEAEKYYWDHFEEIMIDKIDKGEALTEAELRELVFEYEYEDISDASENSILRWTRIKITIVKLDNRFFRIIWQKALTEMQEHIFDNQPVEVEEYEKVIVVKAWREIE